MNRKKYIKTLIKDWEEKTLATQNNLVKVSCSELNQMFDIIRERSKKEVKKDADV